MERVSPGREGRGQEREGVRWSISRFAAEMRGRAGRRLRRLRDKRERMVVVVVAVVGVSGLERPESAWTCEECVVVVDGVASIRGS